MITILGILIAYVLLGFAVSLIPTSPPETGCENEHLIFVASNGIHLDYFIPVVYLENDMLIQMEVPAETAYVSFGWGDKEFYIQTPEWSDLSLTVTAKAILMNTPAAMHVGYQYSTQPHWVAVSLCDDQLDNLMEYILGEFKRDENGKLTIYPGYGPNDRFFDANGRFMFYRTCNVWINDGLKKAGVKTSVWSPFDKGILYHLRKEDPLK